MDLRHKFDRKLVDAAIKKGVNYLWSLNKNGKWTGFPTLAGESDIWVTGFVLTHINHLSGFTEGIDKSQKFLLNSRQPAGGWSYSAQVPPDADSTAWCLMALKSCPKMTDMAIEEAQTFLWSHFSGHGISTFLSNSAICEFIEATANMSVSGWTSAHTDVSIASALADIQNTKVIKIIKWLSEIQKKEGLVNSYWWRGPYYTTTLLLRALSLKNLQLPEIDSRKLMSILTNNQLDSGGFSQDSSATLDSFSTALALESFCHLSVPGQPQGKINCAHALLQSQQENGAWSGDFSMRIPAPDVMDPELNTSWNNADGGGNSFIEDKDGLFATAMACYALDCYKQDQGNFGPNTNTH